MLRIGTVFQVFGNKVHGPRTIQRNAGDQIFEAIGLQLLHKSFHAALFKLKYRVRICVADKLIGSLIGAVLPEFDLCPRILQNIVACFFDVGERSKGKEVHFQHADGFDFLHVELCRDVLSVSGKRHIIRNFFTADDDARGVHSRLAGHSFEAEPHIDDAFQNLVRFVDVDKFLIALPLLIREALFRFLVLIRIVFRFRNRLFTCLDIQSK